ncbi:MAG: alanine--tRNA ligase [Candidatus Paceibacterota bacterium]|jgi:alanyl-tRNA synthetase
MITSRELRKKYIDFFKERGHTEIPSASLVPENDPTVLFTTAGMHPLVPYLMGENHPAGKRLVNVQKCVRTGDIDDVGDSTHNTFFEMLGNWSLGDYFKNESIRWSWEFLTDKKWLGIDPDRIKVTVFEGDADAPRDEESINIWQECFEKFKIAGEVYDKEKKNSGTARIFPLPKEDNWWGPAGMTGPCGPDTEIFIDLGKPTNFEKCPNENECKPGCKCGRYVEIWNNVFLEYNKTAEGKFVPLAQKNVDTGMGMERTLAMLNGYNNVYETDVFVPVATKIKDLSRGHCEEERRSNLEISDGIAALPLVARNDNREIISIRIIADHVRASVFMINDGVVPSNVERGYILRRIIRRAVRQGKSLDLPENFLLKLAELVMNNYKEFYPELEINKTKILDEIKKEEEKFSNTLENGIRELNKFVEEKKNVFFIKKDENAWLAENYKYSDIADVVFDLFQSYGFPLEMTLEEFRNKNIEIDREKLTVLYNEKLQKHQDLSRTASAGKFKGGLADQGEQATKYHTATHLMLESLRRVLGEHVFQKGSNITAERVRFDFSHQDKLTKEQIQKVEDMVNGEIQKTLPVNMREMTLDEAKRLGAMGVFGSKYGERVKVYTIGDEKTGIFSREICGGPHVKNTSEIGKFRIKKEESSSAGVRRIKAVLE